MRSAVLALGVLALAGDAAAYCRTTTARVRATQLGECVTTGVPLSWRNLCASFSLYRGPTPPGLPFATVETLLRDATAPWGRVPCNENGGGTPYYRLTPAPPTLRPTGYTPRDANANTVSFRQRWGDDSAHRSGTIAITIVTFDALTGEIFDADVEFNTRNETSNPTGFLFSNIPAPPSDQADLPTIITHEFGHFLGLAHSDNDRAVMWPEAGLGERRRDLAADDARGICTVYPQERAPDQRCNPIPYGGLALQPGTAFVTGATTCSAAPGRPGSGAGFVALVGLLAVGLRTRKREALGTVARSAVR